MAIRYTDRRGAPPKEGWFPTRPLSFDTVRLPTIRSGEDIADIRGPVAIFPPFTTVALYLSLGLLGIAALYALWRVSRRIRRQIQLARMSAKERALQELSDLLAQRLIEQGRIKEFYFELTMIVRRYIERAHRVRAPEQTTEEFLKAVSWNPDFPPGVNGTVARLPAGG